MYELNGQVLQLDQPFTYNEIQYPANWLRLSTQEDRDALGIVWVEQQPRPNDFFYYVTENPDGTYTAIPKPVPDVQAAMVEQCNKYAYTTLFKTDWMVIRQSETGEAVPADITQYRANVRADFQVNKDAIMACTTIPELEALTYTWPVDPTIAATPVLG